MVLCEPKLKESKGVPVLQNSGEVSQNSKKSGICPQREAP